MELRQRTGLGMMECKKALTEAAGDLAKAEELLRIKSGAKASKAAGAHPCGRRRGRVSRARRQAAAMIEVNCETDFVSRNEDFVAFAQHLAQMSRQRILPTSKRSPRSDGGRTVESVARRFVQKIGENVSIRRFTRIATPRDWCNTFTAAAGSG